MEALISSLSSSSTPTFNSSSSSPLSLSLFSPKMASPRLLPRFPLASKGGDDDSDLRSGPDDKSIVPLSYNNHHHLSLSPLSKDTAMGLVLSAATGRGWTTGSGMEGPAEPAGDDTIAAKVSTFPWSLFTKSPRRRMLIAFTCNICSQRTTRAINPHAYTDGTVFVQCCGCNAYHKLVDNLNLFDGMKCYINSSFKYGDTGVDVNFEYEDIQDGDDELFGI